MVRHDCLPEWSQGTGLHDVVQAGPLMVDTRADVSPGGIVPCGTGRYSVASSIWITVITRALPSSAIVPVTFTFLPTMSAIMSLPSRM